MMRLRPEGLKGMVLGLALVVLWGLADLVFGRLYGDPVHHLALFGTMAVVNGLGGYWLSRLYQQTRERSLTDPLTQTPNRNFFIPESEKQLGLALRHNYPVSLALIDLDSFKCYNDTHGHLAGDQLLREVSGRFRKGLRRTDTLARFGGDEFVFLLPHTPKGEARQLLQRIVREAGDQCVAMSAGVATCPEDGITLDELLRRADEEMYLTKGHRPGDLLRQGEAVPQLG